jgi:hypothetical protein
LSKKIVDETDNKSDIKQKKKSTSEPDKSPQTSSTPLRKSSLKSSETEKSKISKKKKTDDDYELPEIPDYERPELESYEKSEFTPSEFVKTEIPKKGVFKVESSRPKEMKAEDVKTNDVEKPKKAEVETKSIEKVPNEVKKSVEKSKEIVKKEKVVKEPEPQPVEDFSVKKLRKASIKNEEEKIEVPKKVEEKETVKLPKWKKYEELPEIDEFVRPELEVYEKSDFTPSEFQKTEIPKKGIEKLDPPPRRESIKEEIKQKPDTKQPKVEEKDDKKLNIKPGTKKPIEEVVEPTPKVGTKTPQKDPIPNDQPRKPSLKSFEKPEDIIEPVKKLKTPSKSKQDDLPDIADLNRPELEKYEKVELEPSEKTLSRPKTKINPQIVDEDDTDFTVKNIKPKQKKSSEEESTSAAIKTKSQNPPPFAEENVSKDIVIKEPIEIKITEPEENAKKSVTFDANTKPADDSEKKKKPRRIYDPMAWVPDKEIVEEETQAQVEEETKAEPIPIPNPEPPKRVRPKYDPFAYVPDKEDVAPSDNNVDDNKVNT